jgi:Leucine-rich repeat (LRR) protein
LDLSQNQIEEFPSEFFEQLANLRELRLSGNQIAKIDADLFANLEKLEVSGIFSSGSPNAHNLMAEFTISRFYDLRSIRK